MERAYFAFGDLNMDKKVNTADTLVINKHLNGSTTLSNSCYYLADLNQDGKVTMADTLYLRKHLAGYTGFTI